MDTDVVVIGAGAAGIAAALSLAERSIRVIVVEARDRIGGRVMWQTIGSVGEPVELGAEYIHGDAAETSAYLAQAGLGKVEVLDASWVCRRGEPLVPADDDFTSADVFERVRTLAADESVDAFLRRFDHDPDLRDEAKRARIFVEGFEAADPALASARAIADELSSGVDAQSTRPAGSYAPLFRHLAARCASAHIDLRLETRVDRVTWNAGDVTVDARTIAGDAMTIHARSAIVTVPVGVLRAVGDKHGIVFAPPLPQAKQTALRGLEMGHVVRVALAFRTPFWEHVAEGRYRDAAFFRCEDGAFTAFWTQLPVRGRTIVAWAGGPRATAMQSLSVRERIERARDEFGEMFGATELARREYEDGATHDWSTDPFAYGAYSYVGTGAVGARAELGVALDQTLFFAGEATATDGQGGTVSGAFATGMRAAREAADALPASDGAGRTLP